MSKLDLNTKDGLKRLMNEMNSILEKRIKTAELNESIDNVDNISFLECKQIFESISSSSPQIYHQELLSRLFLFSFFANFIISLASGWR